MATSVRAASDIGQATAASRQAGGGSASGRNNLLARLGKVGRQIVVAGVLAVAYWAATTWLLGRFGERGFLYALIALAVAVALFQEFGEDLKKVPARARAAWQRGRDRRAAETAAEDEPGLSEDGQVAPPSLPETTSRVDAEAVFRDRRERRDSGEISEEAFEAFAAGFFFIDQHGKFWTIQPATQSWAYFKAGDWHQGLPLGTLSKAKTAGSS